MPRHRAYLPEDVIHAAQTEFWANGYERTAISDIESRSGVNRSSLYSGIGTKRALFALALDRYVETVTRPLLTGMERWNASLADISMFFAGLKDHLLGEEGPNGCLMVNTITELSGREEAPLPAGQEYLERIRRAFAHALTGASAQGDVDGRSINWRAGLLLAATLGVWVTARLDSSGAAGLCDEIGNVVQSWAASST